MLKQMSLKFAQASTSNKGEYYKVSIAGSTSLNGISNWEVGDWIVSNGEQWAKNR